MRLFLKFNTLIAVLTLCFLTFLSYRAIESGSCVQTHSDSLFFRAGDCES